MRDVMAEAADTARVQAQLLRARQTAVGKKIFAALPDLMTLSKASVDLGKEIEKVKDKDVDPETYAAAQDPRHAHMWPRVGLERKQSF